MNFSHPLWLVGFRPFFSLAMLSGMVLPGLWVLLLRGDLALPETAVLGGVVWHAHEMLFGFAWAVLVGFLLTASKNWLSIRGWHGGTLALLVALWFADRLAIHCGGDWPRPLFWLLTLAGPALAVGLLLHSLIRYREQDGFERDNRYFIVALPLFPLAKLLLLLPEQFSTGVALSLALYRLAFLLMLERTLPAFMQAAFKLKLPQRDGLDQGIKLLALLLVLSPWLPAAVAAGLAALLGALIVGRSLTWSPHLALSRLEVGIMLLGMLALAGNLLLQAAAWAWPESGMERLATHLFTLGTLGAIAPAMFVRICNGHTGRKVMFQPADRLVLWLMLAATGLRVLLPWIWPAGALTAYTLTAAAWAAGFGLLSWRFIPLLLAPRVDGRAH
ncbi:MAG: hypothetical protein RIR00_403 [Pseudomonadota bacterium]